MPLSGSSQIQAYPLLTGRFPLGVVLITLPQDHGRPVPGRTGNLETLAVLAQAVDSGKRYGTLYGKDEKDGRVHCQVA